MATTPVVDSAYILNGMVTGTGHDSTSSAKAWRIWTYIGGIEVTVVYGAGATASWSFEPYYPGNWNLILYYLQFSTTLDTDYDTWTDAELSFIPPLANPAVELDSYLYDDGLFIGTGHAIDATDTNWRVVDQNDGSVKDTGTGDTASFSFSSGDWHWYTLQFMKTDYTWESSIAFFPAPVSSPPEAPALPATRIIEYFAAQNLFHEITNAFFVHCGKIYNFASPTNIVTGLPNPPYADGTYIKALGDGEHEYTGPVTSGSVTFPWTASKIIVGLAFSTIIEPMKPSAGSQQGSTRGKKQKINRATLCFYETVGCKVGIDQNNLMEIPVLASGAAATIVETFEAGILKTADLTVDLTGDWLDEGTISIVHDRPTPFTCLGVIPRSSVDEES